MTHKRKHWEAEFHWNYKHLLCERHYQEDEKQATHLEKIFAKDTHYKVLLSKIYKKHLKFSNKKATHLKNGSRTLRGTSPKKI